MNRSVLRSAVVSALVVLGLFATHAYASQAVLSGVPNYFVPLLGEVNLGRDMVSRNPADPRPLLLGEIDLSRDIISRTAEESKPLLRAITPGVPTYLWWYGCSPTAGGMMVGYWDGQAGYGNLYNGDASVWGGSGSSGTRQMVASTAHITAGSENGQTYGDYHNSTSYPNHEAEPECIADFMKTVDGGSSYFNIDDGLEGYIEWDGTHGGSTFVTKQAQQATATGIDVPYYTGGTFTYDVFKAEIDAGRPVLLDLLTYAPSEEDWIGHSVVGYGYQDAMFQIKVPLYGGGETDMTVGGFAVKDTWSTGGTGGSDWYDWSYGVVYPTIDGNGVEWWPFVTFQGSSYTARNDWYIDDAVTLTVEQPTGNIPEPATIALVGVGCIGLMAARRRRR